MTEIRLSRLVAIMALAMPLAAPAAQNLNINGITIDTASGKSLGSLSSQGGMEEFTKLQKELVMTIIKQLGFDFQSLPPHVRGQIEKPQTTNAQALASFSKGLDLADKGQFQAAAAAFKEAAKNDPGFALAAGMAKLMPHVNLGKEPGSGGNAMKAMRQAAKNEGQQHAHQRLEKMNQANNRRVGDLGVSDGRGKKDGDTKLDAVNLVDEQETEVNIGQPVNANPQVVQVNDGLKQIDDLQRNEVDNSIPVVGEYQGFAAGYNEICPDGCVEYILASGSSSSVNIHFRPEVGQVDVSLSIVGDMLTGSTTPVVEFTINSQCAASESGCGYENSGSGAYSYYYDNTIFWSYKYDNNAYDWSELVSGYYYYDINQFSHSTWGYWIDVKDDYSYYGEYSAGYWVAGDLTPAANIPNSGSVDYSGGMVGVTQYGNYLEGTMNWNVNFGTRTVTGAFTDVTKDGSPWLTSVTVNGGWSANTNNVTANLTGTDVNSGVAKGAFFGPHAEELGGSWRINHANGDTGAGIFLGKPGGVRFQSYVGE